MLTFSRQIYPNVAAGFETPSVFVRLFIRSQQISQTLNTAVAAATTTLPQRPTPLHPEARENR